MLLQDFEPQFGNFKIFSNFISAEISDLTNRAPEHNSFIFYSFFMKIGTDKVR